MKKPSSKSETTFESYLGELTEDEKMWYMALWGRDWDEDYPSGSEEAEEKG